MRKLRIGVIDLVSKGPTKALWARIMNANLASIMPQVVAVWCEAEGHEVTHVCYTGFEDLVEELPAGVDLVFIGAFTEAAQTAYALSNLFRSRGAVTALGGPHARCFPEDAASYFDYVFGFTDRSVLHDVLADCSPHRPRGRQVAAARQPLSLSGVRERWRFIEPTLRKAPTLTLVPMLASLGCPYTCGFCIDSTVPYQQLDLEVLKDDLRFLLTKQRRPGVCWHDPNFGVRFDKTLDAIEEAIPPGSIGFAAESSLSILTEPHLARLRKNGFAMLIPGIESWYDLGNKSKTGTMTGIRKVVEVSEHVNTILRYVPCVQTNFVLGLDCDEGVEPFALTKRFVNLTPGAFPGYSLLSAFGRAAPLNLQYQCDGRVLPVPFHFLDNNKAMNVRPKNYTWPEFYDQVIELTRYSFSWRAIAKRFRATTTAMPRWLNILRAISSEGFGRISHYSELRRRLETDRQVVAFLDQSTTALPGFYVEQVKRDLGPLWRWLPEGAMSHDHCAYLNSHEPAVARESRNAAQVTLPKVTLAARARAGQGCS